MIRNLWPRTRRGWGVAALVVVTFFVLDVLSLMGSELATELLISLAGMMLGMAAAFAAAYPLRDRFRSSLGWRMVGIVLGLASVAGIIVFGTALAGIPTFPTAEGGSVGFLIYGLALGFGTYLGNSLISSRSALARGEQGGYGPEFRLIFIVAGAVAVLLLLTFAAYVAFEFVLGPLVRYFA